MIITTIVAILHILHVAIHHVLSGVLSLSTSYESFNTPRTVFGSGSISVPIDREARKTDSSKPVAALSMR